MVMWMKHIFGVDGWWSGRAEMIEVCEVDVCVVSCVAWMGELARCVVCCLLDVLAG